MADKDILDMIEKLTEATELLQKQISGHTKLFKILLQDKE
jgi:hypothetical protein|tara:strand:- start:973 stop:1092 length:120 start_codon:yes stop_codon:yes gene_type:complete